VLPGAHDALVQLSRDFSLHVVTARQFHAEQLTRCWIERNYPGIFDEVHFGNHYCKEGKSRTKAEICRSINAVMLIDDSISYARNCASEGIPVILFGNYPWNRPHENDCEHFGSTWMIREAYHWNDVVDLVYSRLNVIKTVAPLVGFNGDQSMYSDEIKRLQASYLAGSADSTPVN
jgi:uncharacterized HAD superfamily protein